MVALLREQLQPGETVEMFVLGQGTVGDDIGGPHIVVALTDRRIVGVVKALVRKTVVSWNLHEVNAVATGSGLMKASLVFKVPGDSFVVKRVNKAEADKFRNAVERALGRARPGSGGTPVALDPGARLHRLDELLAQGVITTDEHASKRQAILDEL